MSDSSIPLHCPHLLDLLRRTQGGDRDAEERLLTVLYTPVLRYVLRFNRSAPDPSDAAADLAQEVLIHVCRKLPSCHAKSDEQLLAWVLTLTRNHSIDRFRSRQSISFVRLSSALELLWTDPACNPVDTDRRLAAIRRILRQEVSRLPHQTQEILNLHAVSQATWPSIALELGITATAAKRRYQRAQKALALRLLRRVRGLPERLQPTFLAHLL